jgi:hypothetical protein
LNLIIMKFLTRALGFFALGAISIALSGCPLLFVGGLGYSGYQYHEKEGVFAPGQPLGGPAPDDQNKKPSGSNSNSQPPPVNDHDIE